MKPFSDKCRPYFSSKHAHGDSEIFLLKKKKKKKKFTTNTNEIVEKVTLIVHNGEMNIFQIS